MAEMREVGLALAKGNACQEVNNEFEELSSYAHRSSFPSKFVTSCEALGCSKKPVFI
ncbi:MAG: hypothetical protein SVY53_04945 [Chloroflexota bacterium]|nr:hypothetical protein [Chloroflexota bacterium]